MDDQLLYRAEELQRLLRLSRSKIYEMMASGELPTVRFGRSVRVPAAALAELIERETNNG